MLVGIKHVIQNHLGDVQEKFQTKIHRLELDVQNRDKLINRLKKRIYILENHPLSSDNGDSLTNALDTGSTSSFDGIHYMVRIFNISIKNSEKQMQIFLWFSLHKQREDSMDTIIASSTQSINERQRPKHRSKKRNSPKRYRMKYESEDDSSDQETSSSHDAPVGTMRSYHGLMVTNVVGNVTEMSESVVLNIDRSSNSSSEESQQEKPYIDDNGSNDDADDDDEELHCDDWEVRMLAAELHQREAKKQISSEVCSDTTGDEGRLLRRRRRKESVDAANITTTNIGPAANVMNYSKNRPRAASLDLHSVRRQKCRDVYKTLSFERDKDRL